jgi:hypothetical protein
MRMKALVALLAVAALAVGCPDQGPDSSDGDAASPTSSGDGRTDRKSLVFPVQDPSKDVMQALVEGTLVRSGECLYLQPPETHDVILPIWPHGFSYEEVGDRIIVLDADGDPVAESGASVSMGGGLLGETDTPLPDEYLRRAGECEGPYWIVGEIPS